MRIQLTDAEQTDRKMYDTHPIPDQHAIPCRLKAGWNTILCKTSLIGGYWGFYLRFTDADRVLRYSPYPMGSIGER